MLLNSRPFLLQKMQTLLTAIFSPRYVMRPGRSTRYSASGMKNEWAFNIWVRLSSREDDRCVQKRHDEGDNFARAAAILSSIDFVISSSVASSGKSLRLGVDAIFTVEDVIAFSCDAEFGDVELSDDSGDIAALISFSLCFLDWICERYAFSVVYALLRNHKDEWK